MKLKHTVEPRPAKLRAGEVLSSSLERGPADEVRALIEECRPAMRKLVEQLQGEGNMFVLGRLIFEVYPELAAEFAPTEQEWPMYFAELNGFKEWQLRQEMVAGAVALYPAHRREIQELFKETLEDCAEFTKKLDPSSGVTAFKNAQLLSWIQPKSNSQWLELMAQHLPNVLQTIQGDRPLAYATDAGRLLVYKPDLRADMQRLMLPQLPVAQKVIHERLKNQTYQDIPKLLRGLKIIFAEQVTADEFGRLSFVAQPPLDKPLPLPDRSLAA